MCLEYTVYEYTDFSSLFLHVVIHYVVYGE